MSSKYMYMVFVPVTFNGRKIPVTTHRKWDKYVYGITGGLTLFRPAKGKWVHSFAKPNRLYEEDMIPVLIGCTEKEIRNIVNFTKTFYKQLAVACCKLGKFTVV